MQINISESTRPGKKYMAKVEGERKTVHFGQDGAADYTNKENRATDTQRKSYIARHGSKEDWKRSGVLSPGWRSRYILWEKKSLPAAVRDASKMYRGMKFKLDWFFSNVFSVVIFKNARNILFL